MLDNLHKRSVPQSTWQIAHILRAGLLGEGPPPELAVDRWHELSLEAVGQGLGGLFAKAASDLHVKLPAETATLLRAAGHQTAACNMHMESRLDVVARAFNDARLDLLAIKGVVLAKQAYKRRDLRPMVDVDLLLRYADAKAACRVFENIRCRRGEDLVRSDFFPRFYSEVEYFTDEPHPVKFDVHVRPFRPLRYATTVPDGAFWEDAERMGTGRGWVYVPSAERMLIHVLCHAACHGASRLLWLLDAKMLSVGATDINWGLFLELVRRWRLGWPVLQAWSRAEELFGSVGPRRIRDELERGRTTWRDRLVVWQAPRDADHPASKVIVDILTGAGIRSRLYYLAAVAFPQRTHMSTVYAGRHRGWLAVAHLWRVVRLPLRWLGRLASAGGRGCVAKVTQ